MQIPGPVKFPTSIVRRFMKFNPWVTMTLSIAFLAIIAVCTTEQYIVDNFSGIINMDHVIADYPDPSVLSGVVLLANLWAVDLNAQIMSVSWSIIGACGAAYTGQDNDLCVGNGLSIPMNLYLNVVPTSSWNTSIPAGQYVPSLMQYPPPSYYIPGRQAVPTIKFDTMMPIDPFRPYTQNTRETSTLYYPYDVFTTYISMLAINPTDNSTIPIASVVGYGTVVNWAGTAVFLETIPTPGGSPLYSFALTAERQWTVKVFAIVIMLTNWMMSIAVLWMAAIVLFREKINSGLLLTSTTILFALPQIRASMPDGPSFGAIVDIGGYFMNVCIVSVSTSVLLLMQLRYHYRRIQTPGQHVSGTASGDNGEYQLVPLTEP